MLASYRTLLFAELAISRVDSCHIANQLAKQGLLRDSKVTASYKAPVLTADYPDYMDLP
jgi:hypothetical protein